jgi:outer membrane protein assembly factor BamB
LVRRSHFFYLAAVLSQLTACGSSKSTPGGVLQHHGDALRDGVYIEPMLTKTAATELHLDPTFAGSTVMGNTYAQPLYLNGAGGKPDLVIAATDENIVYAFNATNGQQIWSQLLGAPGIRAQDECSPGPVGITGTPIIDGAQRVIYVDAMTTADGGVTNKQMVFALDADTGSLRVGWPVDVDATARTDTLTFDSSVENQRGALALLNGTLFVPYGGFGGDCGSFNGWVVGISTADPTRVSAWATRTSIGGGIWGPSGISSDGSSLYFATGNAIRVGNPPWLDGEAIFKIPPSLVFSGQTTDYYAPTNWADLDVMDGDLGSTAPIVLNVPGATPSELLIGLGKDSKAYLLDRANLGGIGLPLAGGVVSTVGIINAAAAYTTAMGTYVVFRGAGSPCPAGQTGGLTAIKIAPAAPPSLSIAWCGLPEGTVGSPSVSMTDSRGTNAMVWIVGMDDKLHGLDGDTGEEVFAGGTDTAPGVLKYQPPIVAKGRIFVVGTSQVFAFTLL